MPQQQQRRLSLMSCTKIQANLFVHDMLIRDLRGGMTRLLLSSGNVRNEVNSGLVEFDLQELKHHHDHKMHPSPQ